MSEHGRNDPPSGVPGRERFPDLPLGMKRLARDPKGYPVPWFVDRAAPLKDDGPDFRYMDAKRLKAAIRERRCWVCGLRLGKETGTFVAGPMCGVNRTNAEPPCHLACALTSARYCPFLSHPGRIRDEGGLHPGRVAGVGIKRNPGVTMLWTSGYETWRPRGGGILFEMGEPEAVRWLRMGRSATRAEVVASVTSGLPLLRDQCRSHDDRVALAACVERFAAYLPDIEAAELLGREQGYSEGFDEVSRSMWARANEIISDAGLALSAARTMASEKGRTVGHAPPIRANQPIRQPIHEMSTSAPSVKQPAAPADGSVPAGCAKPLAALAAVYPSGLTEPQWATAAGYKRSGGTWGTYKSRLRGAGLIEAREGRWFATEAGAAAAGDVELPPAPGPDLVRWWAAKLPGTSRMAEALIEAWPNDLDRDELASRIEMSPSGGTFGTYLSRLAGPGLIERSGRTIRLSADAMGAA